MIFRSTWGLDDSSQKNHASVEDVVSRPARMKLMMMSLRNSSELLLIVSLLVEMMNRDRRSVSWAFSLLLEVFLDLMMFMAKSWTVEMDCFKMVF